jgi:hypothetical protein
MTVTIEDCRKRNMFLRTALNCNVRTEGVWKTDGGVVGLVSGRTVHANLPSFFSVINLLDLRKNGKVFTEVPRTSAHVLFGLLFS